MRKIVLALVILSIGFTAVSCNKVKEHEKNSAKKEIDNSFKEMQNDKDYQEYKQTMREAGVSDAELEQAERDAQRMINEQLDKMYQ